MEEKIKSETAFDGLALSRGIAFGKVCLLNENRQSNLPMYRVDGEGVEREIGRLDRAVKIAGERLEALRDKVEKQIGVPESEIFVAQRMILEDPTLSTEIAERIRTEFTNAESAVSFVLDSYEARIAALDDEYISARATDFGEIKRRLLDVMGNMQLSLQCDKTHCAGPDGRVIVAQELTPSLTVDLDPDRTIAFVTEHGGVNSHAAILARAMGIPAVSGIPDIRDHVGCGAEILVNGTSGEVILWPAPQTVAGALATAAPKEEVPERVDPVDGFKVMANISWASEIDESLDMGAEGIGLYRTEFEIVAAERFLSEEELYERYVSVGRAMAGTVVIFRLFDIGSDKSLPFMGIPEEENPSLGWRGARLLLGRRDVLKTQSRALARTSIGGRVHVMYPMIVDVDQFLEIKGIFMDAVKDIECGVIKHGIMFEVPSACLQARDLFEVVDFASIGTNDLTQYLFAVDRDNDLVAYDYNPDRPVFWQLIRNMADAAREANKPLSVCGELAGYERFIPKLVEAGIRSVSVSPRRIAETRLAAARALEAIK